MKEISEVVSVNMPNWSRVATHLCLVLGSYAGIVWPSKVMSDLIDHDVARAWAIFFAISATSCLIGVALIKPIFEYIGLPMLSAAFVFYAATLYLSAGEETMNVIAFASFMLAFGVAYSAIFWNMHKTLKATGKL
jgi:hypothetical protein